MENKAQKEKLIRFLKEKEIYRKFKDNIESNTNRIITIDEFLDELIENNTMGDAIGEGFLWADTDRQTQGFQFWNAVDSEWQSQYYLENPDG